MEWGLNASGLATCSMRRPSYYPGTHGLPGSKEVVLYGFRVCMQLQVASQGMRPRAITKAATNKRNLERHVSPWKGGTFGVAPLWSMSCSIMQIRLGL